MIRMISSQNTILATNPRPKLSKIVVLPTAQGVDTCQQRVRVNVQHVSWRNGTQGQWTEKEKARQRGREGERQLPECYYYCMYTYRPRRRVIAEFCGSFPSSIHSSFRSLFTFLFAYIPRLKRSPGYQELTVPLTTSKSQGNKRWSTNIALFSTSTYCNYSLRIHFRQSTGHDSTTYIVSCKCVTA